MINGGVAEVVAGDDGQAGNVVYRLFRRKFGALPARAIQDVDQIALEIEQPQLENGEQADGACADDHNVCLVGGSHGRV